MQYLTSWLGNHVIWTNLIHQWDWWALFSHYDTYIFCCRCDIYQMRSKQELQQLISGFVRFLETLNKMRRTAQTRRQKVKHITYMYLISKTVKKKIYVNKLELDYDWYCDWLFKQHSGDNVSSTPTSDQQTSQAR